MLLITDCGDVVEEACEVSQSHVKLTEPIFSPRAVLMKAGFPGLKICCDVLIYYKPNTIFLKLRVFLIPRDPALKQVTHDLLVMNISGSASTTDQRRCRCFGSFQTLHNEQTSSGYEKITKPWPDEYLRMHQRFSLTTDAHMAKIQPEVPFVLFLGILEEYGFCL